MVFGKLCIWSKAESFACVPADLDVANAKTKDSFNPNLPQRFYMDFEDAAPLSRLLHE